MNNHVRTKFCGWYVTHKSAKIMSFEQTSTVLYCTTQNFDQVKFDEPLLEGYLEK